MLLQSEAMVAKKWLVDDKITAWVKQLCLLGVFDQKTLSGKAFCSLKNVCYHYLNFVLGVTYCFFTSC